MSNLFSVVKLKENAQTPSLATDLSMAYDLRACLTDGDTLVSYTDNANRQNVIVKSMPEFEGKVGFYIEPNARVLIPTGLRFVIDENYGVAVVPRSGLSVKNGLTLINCTGIIDADYKDEVFITLTNTTRQRQFIAHGERLCQSFLVKRECTAKELPCITEEEANKQPTKPTQRRGGFGSTGKD